MSVYNIWMRQKQLKDIRVKRRSRPLRPEEGVFYWKRKKKRKLGGGSDIPTQVGADRRYAFRRGRIGHAGHRSIYVPVYHR